MSIKYHKKRTSIYIEYSKDDSGDEKYHPFVLWYSGTIDNERTSLYYFFAKDGKVEYIAAGIQNFDTEDNRRYVLEGENELEYDRNCTKKEKEKVTILMEKVEDIYENLELTQEEAVNSLLWKINNDETVVYI